MHIFEKKIRREQLVRETMCDDGGELHQAFASRRPGLIGPSARKLFSYS